MRIGIDAHYLGGQSGGNETHTRNLLRGLRELAPPAHFVVFVHAERVQGDPDLAGFEVVDLPVHSSYLRVPFALPWLAMQHRLDLLHVQYTAPPWCPCPYVVTLHDAVMLRHPESLPFADRHRLRLLSPSTLRRAAGVFTVTEAMRADISAAFALLPESITVTPNALGPRFLQLPDEAQRAETRARYELPEHYVLSLGQIQPRKNLARLAHAFAQLDPAIFPHKLVIAGKKAWSYGDMLAEIEQLEHGGRIQFTGYVDDAHLPALYAEAEAFTFVSLYEGFGIPVIEALACGTPVLASTDPALVEVAGGGALHVDPRDTNAIADALRRMLSEPPLRNALVSKGREHALTYTPRRVAEAAWHGYAQALQAK
jgi:glycosyltransferase involved in cell wall biosynthesis